MFWTLRNHVNFGSTNVVAKLEMVSVDEWLKLLWRIKVERNAAWEARGGGFANTVTEEGWKGYGNHGDACRAAYKRAMELHPSPEAAYLFATLGPFDDETFTSATAAQADFYSFYDNYFNWIDKQEKAYAKSPQLQSLGLIRPDGPNRANSNPLGTRNQNTNSNNRAGSVANRNTENFYNALHAGYDARDKNPSRTQIETGR